MPTACRPRPILAAAVAAATTVLVGCGSTTPTAPPTTASHGSTSSQGSSTPAVPVTGTVTVFAAASLKEAFTTLGTQFQASNPGAQVQFNFGGSSALAASITQGAPADVFASASGTNMTQVVEEDLAQTPSVFARNSMEIVVPAANPANIATASDLSKAGVKVVLCQASVPCGVVGARALQQAGVNVTPVSQEADVKGVLSKVQLGEADAGLVYVTDVRAAGDAVTGIALPPSVDASTEYPIAALTKAPNQAGAAAFTAYVLSEAGRAVLANAGFAAP